MTDTFAVSSSGKVSIVKDPDAILDYTWDWTAYLDLYTDVIASHSFIVDTGITVNSHFVNGALVTAFVSGGTDGNEYALVCRIVTTGGRTDDRTIYLKIKEK